MYPSTQWGRRAIVSLITQEWQESDGSGVSVAPPLPPPPPTWTDVIIQGVR